MQWSAATSMLLYAGCLALYLATPDATFRDPGSVRLWVFVVLLMVGVVAGNLRTIAMPTLVTLLIPEDARARANGLVGSATGVSFLVTSVISGLLVAAGGMYYVLLLAVAVLALSLVHLGGVPVPEDRPVRLAHDEEGAGVDLRGTVRLVRERPGAGRADRVLGFNNFLGGAFMALMDAYGLSLVSVQVWGLLWACSAPSSSPAAWWSPASGSAATRCARCCWCNVVLWSVTALFPVRSSIVLLAAGMAVFMFAVPFARRQSRPCCRTWCRSSGRAGCSGSPRASSRPPRR